MNTIKQIATKYEKELYFLGAYISSDGSIYVTKKKGVKYYSNPQICVFSTDVDYVDDYIIPMINRIPYIKIRRQMTGEHSKNKPMCMVYIYPARYFFCLFDNLEVNPIMPRKFEILNKCYGDSKVHTKRFDDWFVFQKHHDLSYSKVSSMLKRTDRWGWSKWKQRYKHGHGMVPGV